MSRKEICSGKLNFISIQGSLTTTLHDMHYATPVNNTNQLIKQTPEFRNVTGDGTVPLEEALTEPLSTKYLYMGREDHRHMIRDYKLIADVISILRGSTYALKILQPADTQPENLCKVTTPTDIDAPARRLLICLLLLLQNLQICG